MTIKIRYNRAFDIEDVCPGDVLIDRADQNIMYVVIFSDAETEEFMCVEINKLGTMKSLIVRVGFELIDQFIKGEVDDSIS
jgi:hypothetical protein